MILVDTSVWVDHFRRQDPTLHSLIANGDIALHPFVLGELALGGMPGSVAMFEDFRLLDRPTIATDEEVLAFIGWAKLTGTGIGYVDTHLLVSAKLTQGGSILTRDKALRAQAVRLGLAFDA